MQRIKRTTTEVIEISDDVSAADASRILDGVVEAPTEFEPVDATYRHDASEERIEEDDDEQDADEDDETE